MIKIKINKRSLLVEQTNSIFENNAQIVQEIGYGFLRHEMAKHKIFYQIEINEKIGAGAFGVVFDLKNSDRILKIFRNVKRSDSLSDVERIKMVEDQLYAGSGSLQDMHYFELGQLTEHYYYTIMPRIIPIDHAPFWNKSEFFSSIVNRLPGYSAGGDKFRFKCFNDYKRYVLLSVLRRSFNVRTPEEKKNFKDFLMVYSKTIDAIIMAGYRAVSLFKGSDLHDGNIGYIPQRPEIFFFFDM